MSIYHSRSKRPVLNDVNQFAPRSGDVPPPRPSPDDRERDQDWNRLRKVAPANYLLPMSIKWFGNLPERVRPKALAARFPRIANLLALEWTKPADCSAYFDDLLADRRSNRQGFPADVYRELLVLQDYYCNSLHLRLDE